MSYVANEAAQLLDRTSEEIARLGQIVEPFEPALGKGYRALYSFVNLVEMRIAEELAQFGVPRKRIQKYLTALRTSYMRWLEEDGAEMGAWLIVSGDQRWAAGSTVEIAFQTLWRSGYFTSFVAVDVGKIKATILKLNTVEVG